MTPGMTPHDEPKRRPRKGLFILPSAFTAANIAAGYYAISQSILGVAGDASHFDHAAQAIGIAIVLDFFDGGIARLTNTASGFGRELDSLADVITFGVAPAVLAWMWGFRMLPLELRSRCAERGCCNWAESRPSYFCWRARRDWRASISRSIRSRLNPGRPGRKYFVGMPIPAGAGAVAAVVHLVQGNPLQTGGRCRIGWAVFVVLSRS